MFANENTTTIIVVLFMREDVFEYSDNLELNGCNFFIN